MSQSRAAGEVYVSTFPDATKGSWRISNGRGFQARWSRDGKKLFYLLETGKMMSVDISLSPTFKAGTPVELFDTHVFGPTTGIRFVGMWRPTGGS